MGRPSRQAAGQLANPFGLAPSADGLNAPRPDIPHWGETMYFHAWNPEGGVGVWIHAGRCPERLDLWWAQTIAMLPGDRLVMDRSWGSAGNGQRSFSTGNFTATCIEPLARWQLSYDGAGEVTTTADAAARPIGTRECRPFAFDVDLDAAAPLWDMDAALGIGDLGWAHVHHEQALFSQGTLIADGESYDLAG